MLPTWLPSTTTPSFPVPDVRLLLSALTGPRPIGGLAGIGLDHELIAVTGHSFGGWTALAAPEREPRIRAVVALAPGGSSRPVPGVLPLTLAFRWERVVPLLILTGDRDVPVPQPAGDRQPCFRPPHDGGSDISQQLRAPRAGLRLVRGKL
jgi:hypothetical protein